MKVIIDIPKEFESHWNKDRFKDSIMRLSCDIHCLAGNYERELTEMLIDVFNKATQIQSYNMMNKTDGKYNAENG